ncbi:MAG: N-acetylmuramoyl-L-alanine amidase [Balneolaceae bacterium]|nr:N-acetylmuramoyl-L-alanine amidase [Balneolaceae bacterium]
MLRLLSFRLTAVLLFVVLGTSFSFAQTELNRISNVARSDGKGYVVRYHFSAAVDSFQLIQPAPDLIQMVLYKNDIDTSGILMPDQSNVLKEVRLYDLGYGYGVDFYLDEEAYFKTQSYFDRNGTDLLLAFTETPKKEVESYSQQFIARNWYAEIVPTEENLQASTDDVPANTLNSSVAEKLKFDKVIIDPGHGGHDPGNIGYRRRSHEKEIVLSISQKVGKLIEERIQGVEVVYTRDNDTFKDLEDRGHYANLSEGDLFLSIHANAFRDHRVHGTEVFFLGLHRSEAAFNVMKRENSVFKEEVDQELSEEDLVVYELAHSGHIATSEKIAALISKQFKERARRKSRGVKQAGFQVLYEASMPAVLVEVGFLTNPAEQRYLRSEYGQDIIASAIYRAIKEYKKNYKASQGKAFNAPLSN